MIRALEAIHLYLASLPMIAFVALDRGAFSSAVERRFGQTYEGAAYVDKVVDIAFELPAPSPAQLNRRHRSRFEKLEIKSTDISRILQFGFGSNPRKYERFINRMIGLKAAYGRQEIFKIDHHVELLALLVMVQMQFTELFENFLINPEGFRYFINECDNPDPIPDRMKKNSASQFSQFYKADTEEWELFHSVVQEAKKVCDSADFFVTGPGRVWGQIANILGSSAN